MIRGVGERVGLSRITVVVRVHGEIEIMTVDNAATRAGAEHAASRLVGERLDHLDADGGEVGGDGDFLLFAQGQRGRDQVELHAASLRVGPEALARARILELVAGIVE